MQRHTMENIGTIKCIIKIKEVQECSIGFLIILNGSKPWNDASVQQFCCIKWLENNCLERTHNV